MLLLLLHGTHFLKSKLFRDDRCLEDYSLPPLSLYLFLAPSFLLFYYPLFLSPIFPISLSCTLLPAISLTFPPLSFLSHFLPSRFCSPLPPSLPSLHSPFSMWMYTCLSTTCTNTSTCCSLELRLNSTRRRANFNKRN